MFQKINLRLDILTLNFNILYAMNSIVAPFYFT